jgi:hypothetical protein
LVVACLRCPGCLADAALPTGELQPERYQVIDLCQPDRKVQHSALRLRQLLGPLGIDQGVNHDRIHGLQPRKDQLQRWGVLGVPDQPGASAAARAFDDQRKSLTLSLHREFGVQHPSAVINARSTHCH